MQVGQLKDGITAELKTREVSVLIKTSEEMSVLTKTFEKKTVQQMSVAVDVAEIESELSEAESTVWPTLHGLPVGWWLCRPGVRV